MGEFGRYNPFPWTFGGGRSTIQVEHMALLDAFAPGWAADDAYENAAECYAQAVAISTVWAINARLANQAIPLRMLEALPTWEQATGLRPVATDLDVNRRAAVAAKLRGIAGNAVADIVDVCNALLGANFDALLTVEPANVLSYWPGVNPGPPGFEWASNRAIIAIRMNKQNLSNDGFLVKRLALSQQLDAMLPAWMRYVIGTGDGFVCNEGVVGETLV